MEKVIKKTNKATLIAAALIITGATAIFGTYASEDVPTTDQSRPPFVHHEELTEEQKTILEEARKLFEEGDEDGAKALLEKAGIKAPLHPPRNRGQFIKNLTEEQKAKLDQAHELMKAGDKEGAKAIMDELGIKPPHPMPNFQELTDEQKAVLEEAKKLFESGDKEGAKALLDDAGIQFPRLPRFRGRMMKDQMKDLTDEQKAKLDEAHQLMKEGDKEGAKAIMDELGIKPPMQKRFRANEK